MRFPKLALLVLALLAPTLLPAAQAVTLSQDDSSFTLDNGIITARVSKRSGDLISLVFHKLEMLDAGGGRQSAYWSHNTARAAKVTAQVTIDPQANGGERGEVAIKGISGGTQVGSGPGGGVIADIEIRYALGRGDSGLYTYCTFTHPADYPSTSFGEARFCMKLNDGIFDWMTVDANRNMKMITAYDWNHATQMNFKEARRMNTGLYQGQVEHKYDYTANQFDVRAWGWSSTEKKVGIWLVNPSVEYLSCGPTKYELSSHRDATFNTNALDAPAPPTLLNYWRSSHYGGSICDIGTNDAWTKVVGPFLIYCNSAKTQKALWPDALKQADAQAKAWPFDWVQGVDYPHRDERASVTGTITLDDPQAPGLKLANMMVGLTAPDYRAPAISRGPRSGRGGGRLAGGGGFGLAGGGEDETAGTNQSGVAIGGANDNFGGRLAASGTNNGFGSGNGLGGANGFRGRFGGGGRGGFGPPREVDWQTDARNYEFWVRADANGKFTIPNVRAGKYSLHAIADGVLGDLTVTNITVETGKNLALDKVDWQPVRYGRQLWDIGIPNRKASEFFKGDDYFHWGWYLEYPKLFPNGVHYVIGQSDYRKDWFIEQVPGNTDPGNTTGNGRGDATTWTVTFNLPTTPQGKATLRLALCGIGARSLAGNMNGQSIGNVTGLTYNATINRDGIGGSWCERDLAFDASLMHAGANTLALTIPAGGLTSGIMYDYLRLELDDQALTSK